MKRRENLAILGQLPLAAGMVLAAEDKPGETPPFWKSRLSDVEATVGQVARGRARVLARSPGNRPIYLVTYGEPVRRGKATANYNSACGGASTRRRTHPRRTGRSGRSCSCSAQSTAASSRASSGWST